MHLVKTGLAWSQWRGAAGDGQTIGIPAKWFPPKKRWRFDLPAQGIGGVACTEEWVAVSSRDADDKADLFALLDAETGILLWQYSHPSELELDYGNSPRVTPLITDSYVYCLGADGTLVCLDIESGEPIWQKNMVTDLKGKMPQWGYSVSPLLIGQQLIVQPGGLEAAWVALNPKTGQVVWKTGGRASAYASPIVATYREGKQFIGYDSISLGGWDLDSGKRLWEMKPEIPKDFNVPSPLIIDGKIFVVTENNGARIYSLRQAIDKRDFEFELHQEAATELLTGDAHTPVRVQSWIVGVDRDLVVLDPMNELAEVARFSDPSLQKHCSLLVEDNRVWVCTSSGIQILLQIDAGHIHELGRFQAMDEKGEIFSYPAICNNVLYLRGPTWLDAYDISGNE